MTEPDGSLAKRPRGRALLLALASATLTLFSGIAAASAAEPTGNDGPVAGPTIRAVLLECDLLGASDVAVRASGLAQGTTYTASVSTEGTPVLGTDVELTWSASTAVIADLPNGSHYDVSLADPSGATVATAGVSLPTCELPTLDDGAVLAPDPQAPRVAAAPEAPGASVELAATGSSPVEPLALPALGVLATGAMLLALSSLRRRTA